jgi:hypothetical protein
MLNIIIFKDMKKIETSKSQVLKPEPILRDSMGTTIEEDSIVYFNKGGAVCLGKVIGLVRSDWVICRDGVGEEKWWGLRFEMAVQNLDNKLSIIKNPNSFLIDPDRDK